jgi:hypothetical protein
MVELRLLLCSEKLHLLKSVNMMYEVFKNGETVLWIRLNMHGPGDLASSAQEARFQ